MKKLLISVLPVLALAALFFPLIYAKGQQQTTSVSLSSKIGAKVFIAEVSSGSATPPPEASKIQDPIQEWLEREGFGLEIIHTTQSQTYRRDGAILVFTTIYYKKPM